jgi:outer membrane protein assembly factor BamB
VYTATGGASINMQAVASSKGVYFGTWGVPRQAIGAPEWDWIKTDGRYYGLRLTAQPTPAAQELFAPFEPAAVPACYLYPGRPQLDRDAGQCGKSQPRIVSYYNGTIEGTAVTDPLDGTQYVGRGDGKLFAVDPIAGKVKWAFQTFNPTRKDDPDGGGEIIGGPLMDSRGIIYFATIGYPEVDKPGSDPRYETNAVYAVDRAGKLLWRYPSASASLDRGFMAAPALSPDGNTLYLGTWSGTPNTLYALDLRAPKEASDAQRLRWEWTVKNPVKPSAVEYVRHISVGIDGTIYLGCSEVAGLVQTRGTLLAVRDKGTTREVNWALSPRTQPLNANELETIMGVALWEQSGVVKRVYATTGFARVPLAASGRGGAIYVVDPATGKALSSFDPEKQGVPGLGGMTAPTLDNGEVVFAGADGAYDAVLVPPAGNWKNGVMYAARFDPSTNKFQMLWGKPIEGNMVWGHPIVAGNGGLYFGTTDHFPHTFIAGCSPYLGNEGCFAPGAPTAHMNPKFYGVLE